MHVNKTKKIAILGVFAALSTVLRCLVLLFLSILCFYGIGGISVRIIVVRFGIKEGILFYFVCAALDFL